MSLTPWRGRAQVPATMPPPIVDAGMPDSQIVAEELEILLRRRLDNVIRFIDNESSAWVGPYREQHIAAQHHLDALADIRNLLVKARVSA